MNGIKTTIIKGKKDLSRLRRIALASQGLLQAEPFGKGVKGAIKSINHLGYVQLDTISVVERAHHHVFFSRVPGFKSVMVNNMLLEKEIFEYWAHAAALLPISDFRFSLPYKHAIKNGQTHWYKNPDRKLMAELLARIRSDGPLRSRDIEAKNKKTSGWWDWKPAKKALEQLYMEGDLMVSNREGFQKTYDLTERVLPSRINTQMPSLEELAEYLVEQQFRSHGFASLKSFTYLRRNTDLRKTVKEIVDRRFSHGRLEKFQVESGEIFFIERGKFEQTAPRISKRLRILSPFDNAVIQRDRLKSLFNFDYQIECYVPEAKRQYGYFCLPLLFQDQFIGRMDCKAHRKERHLEIKALYFEQHCFNENLVTSALLEAVKRFMHFQQCDTVSLTKISPKNLGASVRQALKTII